MSADEDTELRDLVAQALESNGVLGKIKAQLRASVFLALEEQESIHNKTPLQNEELKKYLATKDGKLAASLVREFLQFFHLDFTLAVFDPESGLKADVYESRSSLAKDLGIKELDAQPLIGALMKKKVAETGRVSNEGEGSYERFGPITSKDLTPKQVAAAREKFDYYDTDKNGTIDKDELRKLFCDVFPGFHRNMIDRYVNDEFRAADKDLSNAIDFDEFLAMYKRLFIQCRSVVSNDVSGLMSPRSNQDSTSRIPSPTKRFGEGTLEESAFSFAAFNENKNRINETHNKPAPKSPTESRHSSVDHEDKKDDDSFFDDPFPNSSEHSKSFSRGGAKSPRPSQIPVKSTSRSVKDSRVKVHSPTPARQSDKSRDKKDQKSTNQPKPGGFLSGAPPLNGTDKGLKNVDQDKELKTIDKNLADLGFDVPEDDYDDDFESNNVSPVIQTPRSARSDHNIKSLEEETDQEIEEQLSVTEDLLKSDNSGADDLTTDRTVSPTDLSTAFDYAEEIHLP